MALTKLKTTSSNIEWRLSGRYKTNTTVSFLGESYTNVTGKNSLPSNLIDWVSNSGSFDFDNYIEDQIVDGVVDKGATQNSIYKKIDTIYQPNVLVISATPTRSTNTFTYPAFAYDALINKVRYKNPTAFVTTVGVAATGLKRTDLVYITTGGVIGKKIGTESATVAIRPSLNSDEVAISFINVFESVVADPMPIDNKVSIQNSIGQHQFYMSDLLRVRGATFDSATKQIIVSPLSSNTAFVDFNLGNDATAELENSKKPFKTIDKVFSNWTGENPSVYINVVIMTNGTYPINSALPLVNFQIYSDFACTLDFSNNLNPYLFSIFNGVNNYNFSFNLKNGKIYSNAGACVIGTTDGFFDIIANEIYWNSTVAVFLGTSVSITYLKKLSLKYNLCTQNGVVKGAVSLDELVILAGAVTGYINSGGTINVKKITSNSAINIYKQGEIWNIGDVTGGINLNYAHNDAVTFNFINSTITGGIVFNQNCGTKTFSGIINSVSFSGSAASRVDRPAKLDFTNLTIKNLIGNGPTFLGGYVTCNFINTYIRQSSGTYLMRDTVKDGACVFNIEKTTLRQDTPSYVVDLDNNTNVTSINIGGFESNCLAISSIKNSPITFDLLSFKDKKKELIIRNKIDLLGRVLDPNMTYVIDGKLVLVAGEYIEIPAGGLTLVGYGFNVSGLSKNVAGQSIFTSAVGGSGDFITRDIVYDSGLGSVFNLTDVDGYHAIEMNDVNFENCTSLGKIAGYRQFTGTTNGFYNCKDGLQLSGNWSGFKITNSNVLNFISGCFIKKDTDTVFSNRLYLDLNLSFATGAKLCDFNDTNFTGNELLQINNTLLKVNGTIDVANTALVLPNITANNPKCRWTNSLGITLTAVPFVDIKTPTKILRMTVDDLGVATYTDIT